MGTIVCCGRVVLPEIKATHIYIFFPFQLWENLGAPNCAAVLVAFDFAV